jgi:hypothetical protein
VNDRPAVTEHQPTRLRSIPLSTEVGADEDPASSCVDQRWLHPFGLREIEVVVSVRFDGGIARHEPNVVGHRWCEPNGGVISTATRRPLAERTSRELTAGVAPLWRLVPLPDSTRRSRR